MNSEPPLSRTARHAGNLRPLDLGAASALPVQACLDEQSFPDFRTRSTC